MEEDMDFTADTFEEFEGDAIPQQSGRKYISITNRKKIFHKQQHYRFYHYSRGEYQKEFIPQQKFIASDKEITSTLLYRNWNKEKDFMSSKPYSPQSFQKYSYNTRSNYPTTKPLHSHHIPREFSDFNSCMQQNDQFDSEEISAKKESLESIEKGSPENTTKKDTQKLKILRHTPVPASAKISPKKIIEKITKFNKASLRNIINNPSKYDEVLQKYGREQALEDQINEAKLVKNAGKPEEEDKGNFEIIPDDTVEVSADFFQFLEMESLQPRTEAPAVTMAHEIFENPTDSNNISQECSKPKLDLMSRLIVAENIKSNHAKTRQIKLRKTKVPLPSRALSPQQIVNKNRNKEEAIENVLEGVVPKAEEFLDCPKDCSSTRRQRHSSELEMNDSICDVKMESEETNNKELSTNNDATHRAVHTGNNGNNMGKEDTIDIEFKNLENNDLKRSAIISRNGKIQAMNNGSPTKEAKPYTSQSLLTPSKIVQNNAKKSINSTSTLTKQRPSRADKLKNVTKQTKLVNSIPTHKHCLVARDQSQESINTNSATEKPKRKNGLSSVNHLASVTSSREQITKTSKINCKALLRTKQSKRSPSPTSSTSSSSSSRSTSSSSSSSSSSESSSKFSSSSRDDLTSPPQGDDRKRTIVERRRHLLSQKLNIQFIVNTFEMRILPNLPQNLARRYKDKYSKSLDTKLLFICRICSNSKYNKERAPQNLMSKIQSDLKSTDKKKAIIILMREVTNVIKKQPQVVDVKHAGENVTNEQSNNLVEQREEQTNVITNEIAECANCDEKLTSPNINGNFLEKHDALKEEAEDNVKKEKEEIQLIANKQWQDDAVGSTTTNSEIEVNNAFDSELSPISTHAGTFFPTNSMSPNTTICPSPPYANYHPFSPIMNTGSNILPISASSPMQQHIMQNSWMPTVHNIDCRISDLMKRKQFISEMILKLQKDSIELDVQIVGLQKEKFMLLNAALSSNSAPAVIPSSTTKTPTAKNLPEVRKSIKRNTSNNDHESTPQKAKSKNCKYTSGKKDIAHKTAHFEESPYQSDKENAKVMSKSIPLNDESKSSFDYSAMPTGELNGIESPINQICIYQDCVIGATEDGHLYRYSLSTLQLVERRLKHSSTITQMKFCEKHLLLFTVSLDGYLKKSSLNNLHTESQSVNLNEPIQSLDIQWDMAFIGTRLGNIYTCNTLHENLVAEIVCVGESSIIAIKATKEGPRKILVISSKGNSVVFRDAMNGLLLRTINISDNLCIYGFLFDESHLYCGTQRQQVLKFDFTSGSHISTLYCGNGVVAMKLYKTKYLIVACYDGYIYFLNRITGDKIEMLPASGRLPLTLEIYGNKLITSSKDKTMKIINIPDSIVSE